MLRSLNDNNNELLGSEQQANQGPSECRDCVIKGEIMELAKKNGIYIGSDHYLSEKKPKKPNVQSWENIPGGR